MNKFTAIAASCLLIFLATPSPAREWRGIVPLQSTREDVRKILGKPDREYHSNDDYDMDDALVSVLYAQEYCSGPPRYYWGSYGVSPGTVLSISVRFYKGIPLAKFKIPNMDKLRKGEPDSISTVDYFDGEQGIEYSVQDGKVQAVEYGPSAADAYLRCSEIDDEDNP